MNLGMTVNELMLACDAEIKKGNGNKYVLLSDDDELNGVHTLFDGILTKDNTLGFDYLLAYEHDGTHNADNCVVLA